MKITRLLPTLLLLVLAAFQLRAAITETYNFNGLNRAIPDGSPNGIADAHSILSGIESITAVRVTMSILPTAGPNAAAFNGDLYVFLQHGSGFTVLINRPGRAPGDSFGYDDEGLIITFDDHALFGDFHVYRNVSTPLVSTPVTGTWQPDGRATDPDSVINTDPRTALLSSFHGLNASGQWTLFAADLSTGARHTLDSYSIQIQGVPEPGAMALLAIGVCGAMPRRRRG